MAHPNPDVERAMIQLLDALCSWERSTGRESYLVLIPAEKDEEVIVADSGKPIPLYRLSHLTNQIISDQVLELLKVHDDPNKHHFID